MKDIHDLRQGDKFVAKFYRKLQYKWEDPIDVNWESTKDQVMHWSMVWKDWSFVFLGGLNEEFDGIHN